MDNLTAQKEEIFALQSIFEEKHFIVESDDPPCGLCHTEVDLNNDSFFIRLKYDTNEPPTTVPQKSENNCFRVQYLPPISLRFKFPKNYPSHCWPAFLLSCNWLSNEQLSKLCKQLEELWIEGNGEVVLFRWIQFLQKETLEFLNIAECLDITELSKYSIKSNYQTLRRESLKQESSLSKEFSELQLLPKYAESESCKPKVPKQLNRIFESIQPSTSGGSSKIDARAFLDLANGKFLRTILQDYNDSRNLENFKETYHECDICFVSKKGCDFVSFYECNHNYCGECLKSYFEIQIKEGNVNFLVCPYDKCTSKADSSLVKQLVNRQLFEKYDALLLSRTLDSMSDIAYCPRKFCHCPVVIDSIGRMGTCPMCSYVFCPYCKMVYHGVAPCNLQTKEKQHLYIEYVQGDAKKKMELEKRYGKRVIQNLVEQTLSEGWITKFSQNCPSCNASIEKLDGCNKITCFNCGAFFCWLCLAKLDPNCPYNHFSDVKSPCYGQCFPADYDGEFDAQPGEYLIF